MPTGGQQHLSFDCDNHTFVKTLCSVAWGEDEQTDTLPHSECYMGQNPMLLEESVVKVLTEILNSLLQKKYSPNGHM